MLNEKLNIKGDVVLVLTDENGNLKQRQEIKNLVVTSGLNYISTKMVSSTTTVSHMAIGTGSTAVAAVNLGWDYIGYDIDQDYIDFATERLGLTKFLN